MKFDVMEFGTGIAGASAANVDSLLSSLNFFCENDTFQAEAFSYWLEGFEKVDNHTAICAIVFVFEKEYLSSSSPRLTQAKRDSTAVPRSLLFDFNRALLLAENSYFHDSGPLNKSRYVAALADVCSRIGNHASVQLEELRPRIAETTKEMVEEVFVTQIPLYARIDNLADSTFPTDFNAYNPNYELNQALRELIAENTRGGRIDQVELRSSNADEGLGKSPLAKGLKGAGTLEEVEFLDRDDLESGRKRIAVKARRKVVVECEGVGVMLKPEDAERCLAMLDGELSQAGIEVTKDYVLKVNTPGLFDVEN